MNILAFDTSSDLLAAGVRLDDGRLFPETESGFRHSETLLPAIERCLAAASISLKDIDLIACARGPGSFMGLRIGISTAKGLSLALGIPWVGVPTLDCLAFGRGAPGRTVVPVMDARKNRLYAAIYRDGVRAGDYLDISAEGLLARLNDDDEVSFEGPDADLLADVALERPGFGVEKNDPLQTLKGLIELGERQFKEKGPASEDEGPLYLREPEFG